MTLLFPHEIAEFEKIISRLAAENLSRKATAQAARAATEAAAILTDWKLELVWVLRDQGMMHELPGEDAAAEQWLELFAKYGIWLWQKEPRRTLPEENSELLRMAYCVKHAAAAAAAAREAATAAQRQAEKMWWAETVIADRKVALAKVLAERGRMDELPGPDAADEQWWQKMAEYRV